MSNYIYVLIDPRDERVFYVGVTAKPEERLLQHLSSSCASAKPVHVRVRAIRRAGLFPSMEVLQSFKESLMAFRRERWWIQFFRRQGCDLTNLETNEKSGVAHVVSLRTIAVIPNRKIKKGPTTATRGVT